jgi:DNA-binding Lrp family transcriptional regulator
MRELWGSPERWNSRKTHADIAGKLGIDEETVRNRLKRLKESGFLIGWRVVPNPELFDRVSSMILLEFEDQEKKEAAVPNLKKMDGVINLASVYGANLLATCYDDKERRASKAIAASTGVTGAQSIGGMRLTPTSFRMTPTDWQIVGLMIRNAEEGVSEVAQQARVSARTVKRRLNLMMNSSAISVMPMVNQAKSGAISYTLMVETEDGKSAEVGERVTSRIRNLVFRAAYSENGLIFGFWATNVAEGTELLRWAKRSDGLKSVSLHLVDDVIYVFDWLEREVELRASAGKR